MMPLASKMARDLTVGSYYYIDYIGIYSNDLNFVTIGPI